MALLKNTAKRKSNIMTELDFYQETNKQIQTQLNEVQRLTIVKTVSYCLMTSEERAQVDYLIPNNQISNILSLYNNMDKEAYNERMQDKNFENKTWFVSGHRDVTPEEFQEYYIPRINAGLLMGDDFIVGDYHGVDIMFQEYWSSKASLSEGNLIIYHMLIAPRNYIQKTFDNQFRLNFKGGYRDDESRDAAMTMESDFDLAWVREGKEKSGTARNLERRKELEEQS
jgi:hypothetical protein